MRLRWSLEKEERGQGSDRSNMSCRTIGTLRPLLVSRKRHPLTQVVLTCAFSDAVTATLYFALLQNDLETRDEV